MKHLTLSVLPERLAICRRSAGESLIDLIPDTPGFWSLTRTEDEISIVMPEELVPVEWESHGGWRGIKVEGPLDFELTGILASLTEPLAQAEVSAFAISTYDTDYLLVKDSDLDKALQVLRTCGHSLA
ncbi:MAG: ACT domain-containing protein [Fidelibacterota bacterium]|nr:MAG: ACT domain-containing protein [Candidatus Neomarinimicrobiota bacterium]